MDLPGATKVPGKGTVITQAALNNVPAGKTLVINTTAGQHITSTNNTYGSSVCLGTCPPPAGSTTVPATKNGTVTNTKTHTTVPVVNQKSPTVAPVVTHDPTKTVKTVTKTEVTPLPTNSSLKKTTTTVTKPDPTSPTGTTTTTQPVKNEIVPKSTKAGTTTKTTVVPVTPPPTQPEVAFSSTEIVTYNGYLDAKGDVVVISETDVTKY